MLVHSHSNTCFNGMNFGGMDIDLSPSVLVGRQDQPRDRSFDFQQMDISSYDIQRRHEFMHSSLSDPSYYGHASIPVSMPMSMPQQQMTFGENSFEFNNARANGIPYMNQGHFPEVHSSMHLPQKLALDPRATLAPISTDVSFSSMHDISPAEMTSPASHPSSSLFPSSNSSSAKPSPKSAPADTLTFGRTQPASGRQRTAQACEKCRDRKTKCSGTRPTCKRCSDRGLKCVWAPETRVRGPSRAPRPHRRVESGDGDVHDLPFSSTPHSLSRSRSPDSDKMNVGPFSAPPIQTTFPPISLPSHSVKRFEKNRKSMPEHELRSLMNTGVNSILGMSIDVLPSTEGDGWDSVDTAEVETAENEAATLAFLRKRGNSVSVAHLSVYNKFEEEKKEAAQIFSPAFYSESPPSQAVSDGSCVSSPGAAITTELIESNGMEQINFDPSAAQELHQPHPSYGLTNSINNMIKMVSNTNNDCAKDSYESHSFIHMAGDDQSTPRAHPASRNGHEDDMMHYLNTDAF